LTTKVNQIIANLQTGTANAAKVIQNGQSISELTMAQVKESGALLNTISASVDSMRVKNIHIATQLKSDFSEPRDCPQLNQNQGYCQRQSGSGWKDTGSCHPAPVPFQSARRADQAFREK